VGTSDPDHVQQIARVSGECLTDLSVGNSGVLNDTRRNIQRQRAFGQYGGSAVADGVGSEVMSVRIRPDECNIEVARFAATGVAAAGLNPNIVLTGDAGVGNDVAQANPARLSNRMLHNPKASLP
jgi:hypothetical protein